MRQKGVTMEILYEDGQPSVYVGTYRKYSEGSLKGAWISPGLYESYDEFMEAATSIHDDEKEPELMYQDKDGDLPNSKYSESYFSEDAWAYCRAYALDEIDGDVLRSFVECYGVDYEDPDDYTDNCQSAYMGDFDDDEEFARQLVEDVGLLIGAPEILENYFDYEAFARDLMIDGYSEYDGHYFRDDWD